MNGLLFLIGKEDQMDRGERFPYPSVPPKSSCRRKDAPAPQVKVTSAVAAFPEHSCILSERQALIESDVAQEVPAYKLDGFGRSSGIADEIVEMVPSSGAPRVRNGKE